MADLQMEDVAHESDISKGPSFSDEEKLSLVLEATEQRLERYLSRHGGGHSRPIEAMAADTKQFIDGIEEERGNGNGHRRR